MVMNSDYIRVVDVPGSALAEGVVTANQVRWFSKPLKRQAVIEKVVLESFDNAIGPTTVAMTAELPDAPRTPATAQTSALAPPVRAATPPTALAPFSWSTGTRVILVGGGSSHDFNRFFNQADSAMLTEGGRFAVNYTEDADVAA